MKDYKIVAKNKLQRKKHEDVLNLKEGVHEGSCMKTLKLYGEFSKEKEPNAQGCANF